MHRTGKATVDPLHGRYASPVGDKKLVLEYEPDPDLRDTEQVPLLEDAHPAAIAQSTSNFAGAAARYPAGTVPDPRM